MLIFLSSSYRKVRISSRVTYWNIAHAKDLLFKTYSVGIVIVFFWPLTFPYNVSVPRQVQSKLVITISVLQHVNSTARYSVVPINSTLLIITLYSSVITTPVYNDTKYSVLLLRYNRVWLYYNIFAVEYKNKRSYVIIVGPCIWDLIINIYILFGLSLPVLSLKQFSCLVYRYCVIPQWNGHTFVWF